MGLALPIGKYMSYAEMGENQLKTDKGGPLAIFVLSRAYLVGF